MTSACYFIVFIKLLCYFDQGESFAYSLSDILLPEDLERMVKSITAQNQYTYLAKIVTPYGNLSYHTELQIKQNLSSVLLEMVLQGFERLKNIMSYKFLQIVPSPVHKEYRSIDEFHIHPGVDGNPKTVGCPFGSLLSGKIYAIHPTKIFTIKESHKAVAQVYENFIRLSDISASNSPYDGGHWSTLVVRSNAAGHIMAIVIVKSRGINYKTIVSHQRTLKGYFFQRLPNITLFHQVCAKKRCTHDESPYNLMYGERYIMETLNGCKFKISPDTFFPTNKFGAEVVYDTIIRTAKLKFNTVVLDLCSGTGMNSIVMSKYVREVIGFESVGNAVFEAKYLAQINNIHNVKFLMGKIDRNLKQELNNLNRSSSDVVAILNHRRAGLGLDIIATIRKSIAISRVVYFFFKPNNPNSVQSIIKLCLEDRTNVPPFKLTKAIPVDLLPMTKYVEIILFFQRKPVENI